MKTNILASIISLMLAGTSTVMAQSTPSAEGATVYFVNLEDGATVTSPFKVIFGLSGMGVAPAGTEKENTVHPQRFINRPDLGKGEDGADELIYGLPADDNHVHFGGGQTETELTLPAGTHTLQMVLGDQGHVPHSPPVTSPIITIVVE